MVDKFGIEPNPAGYEPAARTLELHVHYGGNAGTRTPDIMINSHAF